VEVVPTGPGAAKAGMQAGIPIDVEPSVQIHVNGPDGSIVIREY
jgi:hypothetical protein